MCQMWRCLLNSLLQKNGDTSAHCSNRNGDHPANYRGYSVLKSALDQRRTNKKKEDPLPPNQN